jgi:membrane-associated phospholipid phosphatase
MKLSTLASSFLALTAGLSALCLGSSSALASDSARPSFDARFQPMRPWEYAATALSLAGTFTLRFTEPAEPRRPNWRGGILWDEDIQDAIATRDPSSRAAWVALADIPFYALMVYPAVDALAVAGVGWRRWNMSLQLLMMDLEAFAVAAPLIWVTQYFVLRERPYMRYACEADTTGKYGAGYEEHCGDRQVTRSFPSGHVAIAATGAALTCVHHTHVPLYGGGFGDALACGAAIGATALTSIARVAADKHYVSDVATGIGIGAFAGWLVPKALHYTFKSKKAAEIEAELAAEAEASKRASAYGRPTLLAAFPSLTFGPRGTIDGFGAAALGAF